ncbi:MAG: nucleotide exchange factor GrpE [Candidatus Latescibacterota bacterium]
MSQDSREFREADEAPAPTEPEGPDPDVLLQELLQHLASEQAAVGSVLGALQQAIVRAGRQQVRTMALAEARQGQIDALLEQLDRAAAERERQAEELRETMAAAGRQAELQVVHRLLPALDGLDQALSSAQDLSRAASEITPGKTGAPRPWWRHLWPWPRRSAPRRGAAGAPDAGALAAWTAGLALVRQRFLSVLAASGVEPMQAAGAPFDPARHVAVEAVRAADGATPGTIVEEIRRGYLSGDQVVRPAEVAVARGDTPTEDGTS